MTILSLIAFSLLFTKYFTPIQKGKDKVIDWYIKQCIRFNQYWAVKLAIPFSCPKCFGLWFTWVYTQSLSQAMVVAVGAMVVNNIMNYTQKND